ALEPLAQGAQARGIEAGARAPDVAQQAALVVHPEHERAEEGARAPRRREAAHQELLTAAALDLHPVAAAAAPVAGVAALRHDAFEAEAAGVRVEAGAVAAQMLAVAQSRVGPGDGRQ